MLFIFWLRFKNFEFLKSSSVGRIRLIREIIEVLTKVLLVKTGLFCGKVEELGLQGLFSCL